jgi:hypothetical protein
MNDIDEELANEGTEGSAATMRRVVGTDGYGYELHY